MYVYKQTDMKTKLYRPHALQLRLRSFDQRDRLQPYQVKLILSVWSMSQDSKP